MVSKNFDGDKSVMKSIERNDFGWFGIGNKCKSPYG